MDSLAVIHTLQHANDMVVLLSVFAIVGFVLVALIARWRP